MEVMDSNWNFWPGFCSALAAGFGRLYGCPQWWANSLIGAAIGCIYLLIATPTNVGKLPPTEAGAREIGQWLGFKESLPGPDG